jgi:hypothetical protein
VRCTLQVGRKLKEPISVRASADVTVAGRGESFRVAAPQVVQVVPVGWFKVWQDWAVAAVGAFLLAWLLFGCRLGCIPTRASLSSSTPPLRGDLRPEHLKVTLTPVNADTGIPDRKWGPRRGKLLPAPATVPARGSTCSTGAGSFAVCAGAGTTTSCA